MAALAIDLVSAWRNLGEGRLTRPGRRIGRI
jgi:hypothetical protein